jgi:hypothetical protein
VLEQRPEPLVGPEAGEVQPYDHADASRLRGSVRHDGGSEGDRWREQVVPSAHRQLSWAVAVR